MAIITPCVGSAERILENYAFHSYTKDNYITESCRRKKPGPEGGLIGKQSDAAQDHTSVFPRYSE